MDQDSHCCITELSIDLKCTRKPSREERGPFGRKSVLGRIERTLGRLASCSKGSRIYCNNSQHDTANRGWATKAEVMKRMSSVGVIHIATHVYQNTGEIVLSDSYRVKVWSVLHVPSWQLVLVLWQ